MSAVLLTVLLAACAQPPSASPTATHSATATPRTAIPSSTASPAGPSPASVDSSLLGLMPASVNGAATTTAIFAPSSRRSPRVFLKVIASLGKKPPDGHVALAFNSDATIYALEVDGIGGEEILRAFLTERIGAAAASDASTIALGGKRVIRYGASGGSFVYGYRGTFFYLECRDEATAAEVLTHLP